MDSLIIVLVVLLVIINIGLIFFLIRNKPEKPINPEQTFKDVINNVKKVLRLKNQNHILTVRKFGKACSYPGTFMGSIHAIITSNTYKSAITKTIKAGGCNCSRANFVGAYFAALKPESIPTHWVKRTLPAKNILKYINS